MRLCIGCWLFAVDTKEEFAAVHDAGEGTSSGRWEIVASLGEGGYAEVYQVRDTLTVEAPNVRSSTWRRRKTHIPVIQHLTGFSKLLTGAFAMQYALKIDTQQVKKDPRLATVRNEAEVSASHTSSSLLLLRRRSVGSSLASGPLL